MECCKKKLSSVSLAYLFENMEFTPDEHINIMRLIDFLFFLSATLSSKLALDLQTPSKKQIQCSLLQFCLSAIV